MTVLVGGGRAIGAVRRSGHGRLSFGRGAGSLVREDGGVVF